MSRSHIPLHCPNARLTAAGVEAWEGRDPGGVRVLLANPRWERRLVRFLELSGVGRVMADGVDEDGARAAQVDEWIAWGTGEGAKLILSFRYSFIKGDPQRTAGGDGFLLFYFTCSGRREGHRWFFLGVCGLHIPLG